MRPALVLGGVFGLLVVLGVVCAQSPMPLPSAPPAPTPAAPPGPPAVTPGAAKDRKAEEKRITAPDVEVRCGGTPQFYVTSKLARGDIVTVVGESTKFPGWLEIKPPRDSFSWINALFVKRTGPGKGVVIAPPEAAAPVLAGSVLHKDKPNVETDRLARGTQVSILQETPKYEEGGDAWLPIAPTEMEVRYLPAAAVAGSPTVQQASGQTGVQVAPYGGPPAGQAPRPDEDDLVQRIMKLDPAKKRQLLELLGGQPAAPQPQAQTQTGNGWAGGGHAPGQLASANRTTLQPPQTTSLYNNSAPQGSGPAKTGQAQWSSYGVLRKTALLDRDGQPMYVLEDPKGAPLVYAKPEAGKTLDPYLGKMIALYGPVTYRSDDLVRWYYMTVSYATQPQ
jgi:hypothetical protein